MQKTGLEMDKTEYILLVLIKNAQGNNGKY
jgi:hypothetical protein